MQGKLITIEGIDGSGKSSICKLLQEDKEFINFKFTREPTDTWIGDTVNYALKNDTDQIAELMLFLADHAQHIATTIRPALINGVHIISDRYSASRCAYQGVTLKNKIDDPVKWIQNLHNGWTINPDFTILLDLDPEKAVQRCDKRGEISKFEKIEFLKQVRCNFLTLAEENPTIYTVVNANQNLNDVKEEIVKLILDCIS